MTGRPVVIRRFRCSRWCVGSEGAVGNHHYPAAQPPCTCSTWLVSGGQLGQGVHLVHVSACGRLWTVQGHYLYHCSVQSVQPVRCDANCALVSTPGPTSIAVWSINPSSDLAVHGTQSGHPLKAIIETYRVFSKGRNVVGPSKSLIFWTFSDVLDFFWPFNMGDFSFWYIWVIWLKKKLKNLIFQKGWISGLAQIDIFSDF